MNVNVKELEPISRNRRETHVRKSGTTFAAFIKSQYKSTRVGRYQFEMEKGATVEEADLVGTNLGYKTIRRDGIKIKEEERNTYTHKKEAG